MQKLVSKYGLAAHLGFLTVAPLVLLPFFDEVTVGIAMLWLTLVAAIWFIMEPSRIGSEAPHSARARVIRTFVRDPFTYFMLLMVILTLLRWINSGIGLKYDAELMSWVMREPAFPLLPGSVSGHAFLPFVTAVSLFVVLAGIRHGLGRMARTSFALVAAGIAAIAGLVMETSSSGLSYVFALLLAVCAIFSANEDQSLKGEMFAALGIVGTMIGIVKFCSKLEIAMAAGAFLLLLVLAYMLVSRRIEGGGSFLIAVVVIAAVSLSGIAIVYFGRIPLDLEFFDSALAEKQQVMGSISFKVFQEYPWIGTGLGSFPIDMKFYATSADYKHIFPGSIEGLTTWWYLIAERGVVGSAFLLTGFGFLTWTYFHRIFIQFFSLTWRPFNVLFLVASAFAVAAGFFSTELLKCDVLMLMVATLALAASSAPRKVADGK